MIILLGRTGYVALYEIVRPSKVVMLAVRHQRDEDYHRLAWGVFPSAALHPEDVEGERQDPVDFGPPQSVGNSQNGNG